jgi:hypothetical protein
MDTDAIISVYQRGSAVAIVSGLSPFAFLLDMNQLFEEFIAEFIRREIRINCELDSHRRNAKLRLGLAATPSMQFQETRWFYDNL